MLPSCVDALRLGPSQTVDVQDDIEVRAEPQLDDMTERSLRYGRTLNGALLKTICTFGCFRGRFGVFAQLAIW